MVDLESVPILVLEVCTRFSLVKKIGNSTANLSPREVFLCDYKDILRASDVCRKSIILRYKKMPLQLHTQSTF